MRSLPFAAVLAWLLPVLPAQGLLTAETLNRLHRVGGLALSPDGKHLLLTVSTPDVAANKSTSKVWLLPLPGPDQPAAAAVVLAEGSSPMWLPNGSYAFATATGLEVRPLLDGPRVEVEMPDGCDNVVWSPTGDRFAFTRSVKLDATAKDLHPDLPKANARIYDDLMVRHWSVWHDGSYSHLFVRNYVGGGGDRDLMPGQRVHTPLQPFGGAEQIAWSPDGKWLCYTASPATDPESSTDSRLFEVSADGGEAKCLTPELPGYDQDPVYSPDGRWIAFSSMARGGFEADRVRVVLHDRRTGENAELLPDFDASAHELRWSADSRRLFFTVESEGTTQIYTASLEQPKAVAVTAGRHALSNLLVAPDGQWLYALRATMERPAEVVRIHVDGGRIEPLTDYNGEVFRGLRLPQIDGEWFDTSDGKKVHAWIVKPPDFDPAKRYPFLLYCQGGPQSMVGQGFSFRWNFHLMAAKGYVVAGVNRRGLPGFGQQWNDDISKDWGGQCMRDLLAVCDAMQARPYVDKARTGAVGASFGGFTVYWLMGNGGDRFAAMISHCGVFNLESMYLATEELWFVNWDLGGPFWASPEVAAAYRRFSPNQYVQNWKTPLLVITGERDYRVPYDQSLQAFTAAQLMHVPSRLLVFPDEGHWILKPQNGVLWQREFFGWLDLHLGAKAAATQGAGGK